MNSVVLTIIIVAILIGPFIALAGVSLGGYIYHGVKKNTETQQKYRKMLVPTAITWGVLIAINITLIIIVVVHNDGDLVGYFSRIFHFLQR